MKISSDAYSYLEQNSDSFNTAFIFPLKTGMLSLTWACISESVGESQGRITVK